MSEHRLNGMIIRILSKPLHFLFRVVTAAERPTVPTDTTVLMAEDDKDGCPRCGGMVSVANFSLIFTNGSLCKKHEMETLRIFLVNQVNMRFLSFVLVTM